MHSHPFYSFHHRVQSCSACTLELRGQIHFPYFISTLYVLCGPYNQNILGKKKGHLPASPISLTSPLPPLHDLMKVALGRWQDFCSTIFQIMEISDANGISVFPSFMTWTKELLTLVRMALWAPRCRMA